LEKHLNRQKQFLEKVINLNPSIIIILDENGEWMLDNLAAKTLLSDLGEGARQTLSSRLLSGLKRSNPTGPDKITVALPNGSQLTFLLYGEQIPARYLMPESEQKGAFLITLSDITELEKKNREILVRQRALLASRIEKNLIQGEFINGFIYHLQKPLNIAKAAISRMQVAVKQHRTDKIEQTILLLDQELEFLENELVKFRAMQQSYPKNPEVTQSGELVEAVKILFQDSYRSGRILLNRESVGEVVYPFPYEIMQLMLKILIDNALESAGETASDVIVKIGFHQGRNESLLIVEDSGPGISKKVRYKVFEPFYSTKPNRLGLSLTIMHQLLNNIRGSVDLSCSELGGAKMTLFFPLESA
jgi:signal transduction histidine kinase